VSTATELDLSALKELDFAPPCDYRKRPQKHGEKEPWICQATAKWIVWIDSCHKPGCGHGCSGHLLCDDHKEMVARGDFYCVGCGVEQRAKAIEAL